MFAVEHHIEATWGVYQRTVAAYRKPDRAAGNNQLTAIIAAVSHDVAAPCSELIRNLTRFPGHLL